MKRSDIVRGCIKESIQVKENILNDAKLIDSIIYIANVISDKIRMGNKVFIAGNGGSASDALHITGELIGRFELERVAYPCIALNADVASLTAIANDYGYEHIFSRQLQGLMKEGDVFIGISTSGNSKNILKAMEMVKEMKGLNILLSGGTGGACTYLADNSINVIASNTARIQESHIMIGHIICSLIEQELVNV